MKFYNLFFLLLTVVVANAQTTGYLGPYDADLRSGPDINTRESVMTVYADATSDPNDPFGPPVFVEGGQGSFDISAIFSNQVYNNNITTTAQPDFGLMFGTTTTYQRTNKEYEIQNVMRYMNSIGDPSSDSYEPSGNTADVLDPTELYSFNILANAEGLNMNRVSTNDIYYLGDITMSFTEAQDYPIMHVTGLGGFWAATSIEPNAQFYLLNGAHLISKNSEYQMEKLSGTSHTILTASGYEIYNDFDHDDYITGGTGTSADEAGTGSFRILGEGVTSVTFEIWLEGKPDVNITGAEEPKLTQTLWTTLTDSQSDNPGTTENPRFDKQSYAGDQFNISWTFPTFSFGGIVVVDDNKDGTTQEDIVATADPVPSSELFAVLVDEDGNVAQVQPVATDGTFNFTNVWGDNYSVVITTTQPSVGDVAPSPSLPDGWYNQEEGFDPTATNSSDGESDGSTNASAVNYSTADNIETQDLIIGITQVQPSVLPVELVYFTAEAEGVDGVLAWGTASEENNSHFEVERSVDGVSFEMIERVESLAVDGNSQVELNYGARDKGVAEWLQQFDVTEAYYRIKQVDIDGTSVYTQVRVVSFEDAELPTKLFPNPVSRGNDATLQMMGIERVEVYAANGELVKVIEEPRAVKSTSISTGDLAKGAYVVIVNGKKTLKMIVQ